MQVRLHAPATRSVIPSVMWCAVLLCLAVGVDTTQLLKGVEARHNRARTVQVLFEQMYTVQGRPNRTESGELSLRKPGRMRWQYESPKGKLFLSDGKSRENPPALSSSTVTRSTSVTMLLRDHSFLSRLEPVPDVPNRVDEGRAMGVGGAGALNAPEFVKGAAETTLPPHPTLALPPDLPPHCRLASG